MPKEQTLKPVEALYKKEAIEGASTPERRGEIARLVVDMVEAGLMQRGSIKKRWERNLKYYENDPDPKGSLPFKNAANHHAPLVQPIIDTLVESVIQPITEANPYWIASIVGDAADHIPHVEHDLSFLARNANFESAVCELATIAAVAGIAMVRVPNEVVAYGFHTGTPDHIVLHPRQQPAAMVQIGDKQVLPESISYAGPVYEVYHPMECVVYPLKVNTIGRARFVGHKVDMRVQEIREYQKVARFFADTNIFGAYDIEDNDGVNQDSDLTAENGSEVEAKDESVEVWAGIAKLDLDYDGIEEKYEVVVARHQKALLDITPYTLANDFYIDARLRKEHGQFFPNSSIADSIQATQSFYNEMHNLLLDGAQMSAFPPTFMPKGMMDSTVTQYGPGEMHFVDVMPETQQINISFDANPIVLMIQQLEKHAYTSAGLTNQDQGQTTSQEITATESARIGSFSSRRTTGYREMLSLSAIEKMGYLTLEHYRRNFDLYKAVYGDQLKIESADQLAGPIHLRVAGSTMNNSPVQQTQSIQVILQMLPALMQLDPTALTSVNVRELLKAVVTASQLPQADSIIRTDQEVADFEKLQQITQILMELQMAAQQGPVPDEAMEQAVQLIAQVVQGASIPGNNAAMVPQPGMGPSQAGGSPAQGSAGAAPF